MRLSSLCVAAVLLFSSVAFAQHSSGATGSSSASSSSSGGGGSHSSSSGGSSSSGIFGASHSSGGSASSTSSAHSSGGSVSHVSNARSSNSSVCLAPPSCSRSSFERRTHHPRTQCRRARQDGAVREEELLLVPAPPFQEAIAQTRAHHEVVSNLRRWICVSGQAGGRCTGKANANGTRAYCQAANFRVAGIACCRLGSWITVLRSVG